MWAFGEEQAPFERARVVVLPVPYDLSLSFRPGARLGPEAILGASRELEPYDFELGLDPARAGVHAAEAVPMVAGDAAASHALIEERTRELLDAGKFVVALGGDHSITLPLVRAHRAALGAFGVLHVDAHDDLYDRWQGSPLSHASVMRRVHELGVPLVQVGQRAVARDSHAYLRAHAIPQFPARRIAREGLPLGEILEALPPRVYLSFDFDALDPSEMPAVGTPLAGGLRFGQVLDLLEAVFEAKEVVGMDFVEFSPVDLFYPAMTAAQLVHRALGLKVRAAGW
ncbi:agmatinase [Oceanithermus sp.]|uniref:agmatinase n=1 Tax=Oceanithermus sp. TaxID=2268145 RepID=UPI0025D6F8F6|nr:agmatinase [Oceanithermus sp.]